MKRLGVPGPISAAILSGFVLAAPLLAEELPRATPPQFTAAEQSAFFADAFAHLSGERPDFAPVAASQTRETRPAPAEPSGAGWQKLVSAETLETEIKRQVQQLTEATKTASDFKGGGYKECRDAFALLAVAFAVTKEYDDQARWQDVAAGLRDTLARAAANCKVGTDQTFREASQRATELAELVQGSRPDVAKAGADFSWADVAPRGPLMRRMELAEQERLGPSLASPKLFEKQSAEVVHEAQVLAMLAEALQRPGSADADDPHYAEFVAALRSAAEELSAAPEGAGYESARAALGRASKACADCHEDYRG